MAKPNPLRYKVWKLIDSDTKEEIMTGTRDECQLYASRDPRKAYVWVPVVSLPERKG